MGLFGHAGCLFGMFDHTTCMKRIVIDQICCRSLFPLVHFQQAFPFVYTLVQYIHGVARSGKCSCGQNYCVAVTIRKIAIFHVVFTIPLFVSFPVGDVNRLVRIVGQVLRFSFGRPEGGKK